MTFRSTLAGLALAAVVVSHAQTVLYSTGFERTDTLWAPGTVVVGQDGWSSGLFDNAALRVSNERWRSGSQSAELNLREASGSFLTFFSRPVAYDAFATDIVIGRTSFFANNPGGTFELFFEGTSGNADRRFGGLLVDQLGNYSWLAGPEYISSGTLELNRWHDVEIRFDFATDKSSVFLNGGLLGVGDFEETANMEFRQLTLGVQTESLGALTGSIFFDDYSVSVQSAAHAEPIPEPFTMTLGAAALGLAAARKRRRKS